MLWKNFGSSLLNFCRLFYRKGGLITTLACLRLFIAEIIFILPCLEHTRENKSGKTDQILGVVTKFLSGFFPPNKTFHRIFYPNQYFYPTF